MILNTKAVKILLIKREKSRDWLAEQCRITSGSLAQILIGRSTGAYVVKLMADALGVSEKEILKKDQEKLCKAQPLRN